MARIVKNDQGFKVIAMISEEAIQKCNFGEVCDHCLEPYFGKKCLYYVAVLNMLFCTPCYINWIEKNERYAEDVPYEERNFKFYCEKLGLKEE